MLCLTLGIPWSVACQAPLSMGFSRQEHWSGLPFPSPEDLPDPGIEPASPELQADSFFFFFCSTSLLPPTHLPPPSCTHAQSCDPMDCSPPSSSVHGLFQARILEWVAVSFSAGRFFTDWAMRKILSFMLVKVKVAQSCPTLFDPRVHGIFQARILEWVAFPFTRGSSQPRDWTQVSYIAGRFFTGWATGEAQEYWSG